LLLGSTSPAATAARLRAGPEALSLSLAEPAVPLRLVTTVERLLQRVVLGLAPTAMEVVFLSLAV
jgi:hypothetical protein